MQADELLAEVRRLVRDTEPDYIFSDTAIYAAIADTQDEVMEKTLMVPGTWQTTLPAGEGVIILPPHIVSPRRVIVGGSEYRVVSTRPAYLSPEIVFHENGAVYLEQTFDTDQPVEVLGYVTAELRPSEDNPQLALPERFHYNLALGAAVRLLDTLDADREEVSWKKQLAQTWAARLNEMYVWSARHNRKPRTARYGGI